MSLPRATIRLQFHADFTLVHARELVPYFAQLGVSHLYASPLTQARAGSTHGYDIVDPTIISSELGAEAALLDLVRSLRQHGMGLILDIVPNHMAAHSTNPWWWSVLEHGRNSPYASWFDIDWDCADPDLRGKVLAPFLGLPYGQTLENGDIRLTSHSASQGFQIQACGAPYPIAAGTLKMDTAGVDKTLALHDPSTEQGRARLHHLLERQHYRLAWWRCAADQINWRRFFEVSDLIGIRVEHKPVFDAVHALPLRLFEQGLIDGVRIDHVDGLAQPGAYCRQLQAALAARAGQRPAPYTNNEPYLIVEKILAHDETLDEDWNTHGTTGYDFMDQATGLLHDASGEAKLTSLWERLSQDLRPRHALLEQARELMLQRHFAAERNALVQALHQMARSSVATRDWSPAAIDRLLCELLLLFPVYRTYIDDNGRHPADARLFADLLQKAQARRHKEHDSANEALLKAIDGWLGGQPALTESPLRDNAIRRFQQLTPALAAKSLEDTVFYRYGRLLSRNEVGSDLKIFALSASHFHRHCTWRAEHAPRSMLATATHDHKRGEDVRARLAVLSEIPDQWAQTAGDWLIRHADDWARTCAKAGTVSTVPHAADRYMLYQTVVGAWPLDLEPANGDGVIAYAERLVRWQTKALREAKIRSNWFAPNLEYEKTCTDFTQWLMQADSVRGKNTATFLNREQSWTGSESTPLQELANFVRKIAAAGAVNSLCQTVLRMTVPGMPDLYQGTELWDFSLVDPDNRQPVDFHARIAALSHTATLAEWRNGQIKQDVVRRCLQLTRDYPSLFAQGGYAELPVDGVKNQHVVAFSRTYQTDYVFVIVPHLCWAGLEQNQEGSMEPRIRPDFWDKTQVTLPSVYAGARLKNILSGDRHQAGPRANLGLADTLRNLPVAILIPELD